MCYVLHDGKRLYFPKTWDEERVKAYYNAISSEQDIDSPHRYETADFHVEEGDVIVDVGSAEGNFALDVVERAKKLYLFEVEPIWIEALEATFAPYKNKVVIVNKYVSDNNDENCVTLDNFFSNEKIDFIKADIEGAEPQLLAGAKNILASRTSIKMTLCTYHRHNDAAVLQQVLNTNGFRTEFSRGYMIFIHDRNLRPPYLRRALIRAKR
jgi:hypothetical protein